MSIFRFDGRTGTNKQRTLGLLREKGVTKAVLYYSGGNDEGGVNEITLFFAPTAAGEEVTQSLDVYYGEGDSYEWDEATQTHKRVPAPPPTPDEKLSELLCQPVDDKYGTWAGEFEAYGTLTWDVAAGTVKFDEEVQSGYEHREESW